MLTDTPYCRDTCGVHTQVDPKNCCQGYRQSCMLTAVFGHENLHQCQTDVVYVQEERSSKTLPQGCVTLMSRVLGLSFDNVVLQVVQVVVPVWLLVVVAIAVLPRVLGLPFDNAVLLQVVQVVVPVWLVVVVAIAVLPRVLGLRFGNVVMHVV